MAETKKRKPGRPRSKRPTGRPPKITQVAVRAALVAGLTTKQIADSARVSVSVVNRYRRSIDKAEPGFMDALGLGKRPKPAPIVVTPVEQTAESLRVAGAIVSKTRMLVHHETLTADERANIVERRRDTVLVVRDEAIQVLRDAMTDCDDRIRIVAATAVLKNLDVPEEIAPENEITGQSPLDQMRELSATADPLPVDAAREPVVAP